MELDCVEIFQAEVWKIIPCRIFKIAWSQFGNLKPKWRGKLEVENVALSYWIWKIRSEKKYYARILNSESVMEFVAENGKLKKCCGISKSCRTTNSRFSQLRILFKIHVCVSQEILS